LDELRTNLKEVLELCLAEDASTPSSHIVGLQQIELAV
jgi:hypothetical protein